MTLRAMFFGFVLATAETVRVFFQPKHTKAVIHVLQDVECPPFCYIKIEEQVFAVQLR